MANDMPVDGSELQSLKESGLVLESKHDDVRGREVYDKDDNKIGHVDDLIVDDTERKVRFLRIGQGGFLGIGQKHYLVPVDAITNVTDDAVRLGSRHEQVSGAPDYDPELSSKDSRGYWGGVYEYWDYAPFWGAGYMYPAYPLYGDGIAGPWLPPHRRDIPRD